MVRLAARERNAAALRGIGGDDSFSIVYDSDELLGVRCSTSSTAQAAAQPGQGRRLCATVRCNHSSRLLLLRAHFDGGRRP